MRFVGITGGVGAGKSAILSYLAQKPRCKVMLADEIAHMLMEPGTECYRQIVMRFAGEDIFGEQIFFEASKTQDFMEESRPFDKGKLAQIIFSNPDKRMAMNAIVHPAVKDYVKSVYRSECRKGQLELLVLEAALLIEEKYDEICDELWYIYTNEAIRRQRLKDSRGYSDAKIESIFKSQLSEEVFRESTDITIDNNGTLEKTFEQIENALRREADE